MDEVGNIFQVHYHSGWAYMARYASICFSCSMKLSALSQSNDVVLLVMPRKSRASPKRLVARPRRLVSCVSRSGTWRVTFVTRKRHF
jgi:hypothetical protein